MHWFHIVVSLVSPDVPCLDVFTALPLPASVEPTAPAAPPSVAQPVKDARFGPISLDWMDMPDSLPDDIQGAVIEEPVKSSHGMPNKKRGYFIVTSGAFVPFRIGSQELGAGVLHLYRDPSEVQHLLQTPREPQPGKDEASLHGTVLAILAVPNYMSIQDFIHFVGSHRKSASHFRILRDALPSRYMVLIKFRTPQGAEAFYKAFNGREFSSLEAERCHVVYVKSVEFRSLSIPPFAFPPVPNDPMSLSVGGPRHGPGTGRRRSGAGTPPEDATGVAESLQEQLSIVSRRRSLTDPASFSGESPGTASTDMEGASPSALAASAGPVELPTCPVCLERMDASVTGLLTTMCYHTFHCTCLAKWADSTCPICRYSSLAIQNEADLTADANTQCETCSATQNLWICLICGNIGCGRYQQAHAYNHFSETNHLYSLELETQRVWDYAGDGYVHRLIQNKADGKLVELPPPLSHPRDPAALGPDAPSLLHYAQAEGGGAVLEPSDKLDAMGLEYSYLLISQLQSQRVYYEEQVARAQKEAVIQLSEELDAMARDRDVALRQRQKLEGDISEVLKANKALSKKLEKALERLDTLEKDVEEERLMNTSLRENQHALKKALEDKDVDLAKKDNQINELQEQVRDLMFFLETRDKVAQSPMRDELANGQVVMEPKASASSSRRRKNRH